jgi:hypothetical protein
MPIFGKDAKLFYGNTLMVASNQATAEAINWGEIVNVVDLTDNFTPTEVEVTTRQTAALGWEASAIVLNAGEITWGMLVEEDDAAFDALINAFLTKSAISLLDMTGPHNTNTSIGLVGNFTIGMTFGKPVKGVQTAEVTAKLFTYPFWATGSTNLASNT